MARSSKLNAVTDWPALAKHCHYEPGKVADQLGVKLRCLEQFFGKHFNRPPLKLFSEWMAEDVCSKRQFGMLGKEILEYTGYKHQSSLTRATHQCHRPWLSTGTKTPGKIASRSAKTKIKNDLELR